MRYDPENPVAGGDYVAGGSPLSGRKVAFVFCAFIATFVTVDLFMWKMAASTFSGLVSQRAFRDGVNYNQTIAAAREQDERGWKVVAHVDPPAAGVSRIRIEARDRDGRELVGLRAQATLSHPADSRRDRVIELKETGLGVYTGETSLEPGAWRLVTELYRGETQMFLSRNRIQTGG